MGLRKRKKIQEEIRRTENRGKRRQKKNGEQNRKKIERNRKQQNNIRISQFAAEQHIIDK